MHAPYSAWQNGETGQGVTIAVVDTGIDPGLPDLAGRISPLSRDILPDNRALLGPDNHGTQVSVFAAAARNNSDIVGIAYGATILALRADDPGSCPDDCMFSDRAIADSIDYAAANGAKVINLSLGGDGASNGLLQSVRNAVAQGVLIVVSSGNESLAEPTSFASRIGESGSGGVLIAGSVDEDGVMSDFSNRAGTQSSRYIAALGEGLCCLYDSQGIEVDDQGYIYLVSGTSYSAPQISGAAALLAQAFPNLTGKQIAQILLDSARDAGVSGEDAVYGKGILDIAAAFAPSGQTVLAGGNAPINSATLSGMTSGPMGDALATASLPGVVLDSYGRAYGTNLAASLQGAVPQQRLRAAVVGMTHQRGFDTGHTAISFAFGEADHDLPQLARLMLDRSDAERSRLLAARIAVKLTPGKTDLALSFSEDTRGIVASLQGQSRPAFLIAPSADDLSGLRRRDKAGLALRSEFSGWGLTLSAAGGEIDPAFEDPLSLREFRRGKSVTDYSMGADRRFGPLQASLGLSWMRERRTVLGASLPASFGPGGADTLFLDGQAGIDLAEGWQVNAQWRQGWTRPESGGLVGEGSVLKSRAWSFEITHSGAFSASDSLAFGVSQPLRVESGSLDLRLPIGWSYASGVPEYGLVPLGLAPNGRELIGEISWRGLLWAGDATASLFFRRDPGNYAGLADDRGVALRWSRSF